MENTWKQINPVYENNSSLMLNVIGCFKISEEKIIIFGNFFLNLYNPVKNSIDSRVEAIKQSIDKCVFHNQYVYTFTREHPYFNQRFNVDSLQFSQKLSYFNTIIDIDLRPFPACLSV